MHSCNDKSKPLTKVTKLINLTAIKKYAEKWQYKTENVEGSDACYVQEHMITQI
jgi:hypothetical protein